MALGSCKEYHPHAVRNINNGVRGIRYDGNGNNTWRFDGTKLWWQSQVDEFNPSTWTFIATRAQFFYDSGGTRVKKVEGNTTTIYVGEHYEKNIGLTQNI
jgi:hypothetical protein